MKRSDIAAALARELAKIGDAPLPTVERRDPGEVLIPVEDQFFKDFGEWCDTASVRLTDHPRYNDTAQGASGYRGQHFKALCFDQLGRYCTNGKDFMQARDDEAFPIWWIWPDQIATLIKEIKREKTD